MAGENNGTEHPIKMDDLGGVPPIFGNIQMKLDCLPAIPGF